MTPAAAAIYPVLLSGGAGSRLWPLSRESLPKQFVQLIGEKTLLQQTALRADDPPNFQPPTVVANAEHRFLVAEQLREIGVAATAIILEPCARNTAAAIAAAAQALVQRDPDAVLLVMPADHAIRDDDRFRRTVLDAVELAKGGRHVLFGVTPASPSSAYGYIEVGDPIGGGLAGSDVRSFVEKPSQEAAAALLASGRHLWNSGIFLLSARGVLEDLARFEPDIVSWATTAVDSAATDLDFIRLSADAFARSPSQPIDRALMERTDRAAVVSLDLAWTDVGSWSALHDIESQDRAGNALVGDVFIDDCTGSYLRSEGPVLTAIGVHDLVVVAMQDAVLVAAKSADQEVKPMLERLRREGRAAATQTHRVRRPWGWYESLHSGERFQVKRITVDPGAKLSLQKHAQRAEHWVVVAGSALATVGGEERLLGENQSIVIPLGAVHRLANPGEAPLTLIEVQVGAYLGEDDIVRLQDIYARV